jgi:hypothetical protein
MGENKHKDVEGRWGKRKVRMQKEKGEKES